MKIKINGQIPLVQPQTFGLKIMDLDDAEITIRTMDGTLTRSRIAVKRQHEMVWPAMRGDHIAAILQLMKDPFIEIEYPDAETGTYVTKEFYAGDRDTGVAFERDGVLWWTGLSVTLTER